MFKRLFVKNFRTEFLDDNEGHMKMITDAINIITGERYGKASYHKIYCRHDESDDESVYIYEIRFSTTRKKFDKIQKMIKQTYPKLEMFTEII